MGEDIAIRVGDGSLDYARARKCIDLGTLVTWSFSFFLIFLSKGTGQLIKGVGGMGQRIANATIELKLESCSWWCSRDAK